MTGAKTPATKPRGFGAMTPERRKEIARLAGLASNASGRGHKYNSETGRAAALKKRT